MKTHLRISLGLIPFTLENRVGRNVSYLNEASIISKRFEYIIYFYITAVVSKSKSQNSFNRSTEKSPPIQKPKVQEKVKITKVFEFAGEEVKVEKEVSVDSAEARLSLSAAENSATKPPESASPATRERGRGGIKRVGLGGISSVLGQIGKKAKISTLEKSKLDWDNFKKQENIEEELNTHNRGKDGYLERQDFLQRSDLRQFEIEKQLRNSNRRSTR